MQTNTINLTEEAKRVINALQHPCGTYAYYRAALDRIFAYVLQCSDEIGMSDTEAVATLRAIEGIRSDLAAIADSDAAQSTIEEGRLESKEGSNEVDEDDDARAADTDC